MVSSPADRLRVDGDGADKAGGGTHEEAAMNTSALGRPACEVHLWSSGFSSLSYGLKLLNEADGASAVHQAAMWCSCANTLGRLRKPLPSSRERHCCQTRTQSTSVCSSSGVDALGSVPGSHVVFQWERMRCIG